MILKNNKNSQTPPPEPPAPGEDLSIVLETFNRYYATQDPINNNHFKHGKMVDKEVTSNHVEILKTLIYMLIDDIKSELPDQAMQVEKINKSVISCIDLLPETSKNVTLNSRIVAKLVGYTLELHKMHI